jgi:hypothetical protein
MENQENSQVPEKKQYQTDYGYAWEKPSTDPSTIRQEASVKMEKIYGQDLRWYFKIFGWPSLLIVIGVVALEFICRRLFPEISADIIFIMDTAVSSLIISFIAILAILKFKANLTQTILSCLAAALITGVLISIFELFWYGSLWTVFNLIGLPILWAVISFIVSWVIFKFFKFIFK